MVGSPSKKQMRVRDMLQSFGNLFLVRLVIYYEFERVYPGHYSGNPKMLKFECAQIVGARIPVQVASGEEAGMPEQKNDGAVLVLVSQKVNLIGITR